jgi:plastocyanin
MNQKINRSHVPSFVVAVLTLAAMFVLTGNAQAQKYGSIKGQVVWGGDKVPEPVKAKVDKDTVHCLSKGPIMTDDFVVNPKNKGVRWVLIWLADPENAMNAKWKPSSIHPSVKATDLEIDQPCCVFLPRVIGIVAGQTLTVKNSSPIVHNFKIDSVGDGPNANPLIPAGGKSTVKGFVPKALPTSYSCSVHPWMKGYIGTFAHPYFVVTDEDGKFELKNVPAGKQRIVLWQDGSGWVLPAAKKEERGKIVTVEDGKTTDLGDIKLTPSK